MSVQRAREIGRACLLQLPAIIGVLLLIGALYVVQKEFRHLRLHDIVTALHDIPLRALAIGFLFTVLSYAVLTIYDRLGTIYAGHTVSYGRVAFASFCAYALSHNLGFAAVSGAAVRYRLYAHWGLTPFQIAKTVAFCSLTFALGGMVLGGTILFVEPRSIPFFGEHLPAAVMHAVGALLWAIVIGYVTLSRVFGRVRFFGYEIALPGWRMAILQVLLATVDVAITASIFYSLLPAAPNLTWPIFLGVYVASYTAGLAANLPGGIGVFDTAILLGLAPYLSAPHIVGAIVVFRLYYYVIPLFLAGTLFTGNELLLRGSVLLRRAEKLGALARWSEPDFAVASATGLVALCGMMLLCVGILAPQPDFSWIDPDFAEMANQAGQFIPSLIGAGLVVVALGLSQRVNLAWGATIFLLVVGAAFTATQGERLWISGVLVAVTMLVAPLRRSFYRHASLLSGPLDAASALSLFALVICLLALAGTRPRVHLLSNNAWWAVVMSHDVPNSLRLTVALAVALALIASWRLLRPGKVRCLPWDAASRQRLALLGGTIPPAKADGVVLGEAQRAGIPFRRCGRVLLGIGDPVGAEGDRVSAIWRLRDMAQQEGLDPAFWRAGPELLKVYGDLGLTALPLGPDGMPQTESGPEARQYLVCVAERDLKTLLPLLAQLATNQDFVPAAA
ncbi:MAG: phosphatidylglycerol lysyltransferase domain-containing protein [Acetobacteraceae bacterium]|jgi:glycosyltransferase 2 family protein